jgi:hypothetical protein
MRPISAVYAKFLASRDRKQPHGESLEQPEPVHPGPYRTLADVPDPLPDGYGVEEHGTGAGWAGVPGFYVKRLPSEPTHP